jgi:hypothetical protein
VNFLKATMSNTDYVLEGTTQPQSIVRNIYWESSYAFIKVYMVIVFLIFLFFCVWRGGGIVINMDSCHACF